MELADLEGAVFDACHRESEWAAGVVAGIYAGVDFAIAHPELAEGDAWSLDSADELALRHTLLIERFAGFLRRYAPIGRQRPRSTDEALVAGLVGIVVDHLRRRRLEQLASLRPELVLVALLPYLGFEEAQRRAGSADGVD